LKRRLFASLQEQEADVRPTLLGVVTLLFLLLFFLLSTSSGQRMGAFGITLPSSEAWAPLPHTGLIQALSIHIKNQDILVVFEYSSTDIAASATTTEHYERSLPALSGKLDRAALLSLLTDLHQKDPSRTRATVIPDDAVSTEDLFIVLDLVRGSELAPLFPEVALGSEP
jgi:hypothetical protein